MTAAPPQPGRGSTEVLVYLPFANIAPPTDLARELIGAVNTGRAEVGVDLLTGGVEIRFFYAPGLVAFVQDWAKKRGATVEVEER